MKDAFAPGPLDESKVMSSLGPIFDIALKDITGHICGTAEFSGWYRDRVSEWDSFSLLLPCPPLPLVEFLRSFPSDQTTKW